MRGAMLISASRKFMTIPSRPAKLYSDGTSAAAASKWRRSGETPTTSHLKSRPGHGAGSNRTLRVWTAPNMRTECGVATEIKEERTAGATQDPFGGLTARTTVAEYTYSMRG